MSGGICVCMGCLCFIIAPIVLISVGSAFLAKATQPIGAVIVYNKAVTAWGGAPYAAFSSLTGNAIAFGVSSSVVVSNFSLNAPFAMSSLSTYDNPAVQSRPDIQNSEYPRATLLGSLTVPLDTPNQNPDQVHTLSLLNPSGAVIWSDKVPLHFSWPVTTQSGGDSCDASCTDAMHYCGGWSSATGATCGLYARLSYICLVLDASTNFVSADMTNGGGCANGIQGPMVPFPSQAAKMIGGVSAYAYTFQDGPSQRVANIPIVLRSSLDPYVAALRASEGKPDDLGALASTLSRNGAICLSVGCVLAAISCCIAAAAGACKPIAGAAAGCLGCVRGAFHTSAGRGVPDRGADADGRGSAITMTSTPVGSANAGDTIISTSALIASESPAPAAAAAAAATEDDFAAILAALKNAGTASSETNSEAAVLALLARARAVVSTGAFGGSTNAKGELIAAVSAAKAQLPPDAWSQTVARTYGSILQSFATVH